jgi:adenylate kinase
MRLLMLGAPGAGKGTQASRLARYYGIEHIASGELLRQQVRDQTPLGRLVKGYLDRGDLVPDDLMMDVIAPRIEARPGFVLDGFPRNLEQQEAAERRGLWEGCRPDAAIYLEVGADELLRRLLLRAAEEGRADDREATIRHRLSLFDAETRPLIDCYRDAGVLITVDGDQDADKVFRVILDRLEPLNR